MEKQGFHQIPEQAHPSENMPGCGLASYGCILIGFFLVGIIGLVLSSLALMQSTFQRDPFSFVPGNQVKVWRLQPMRDAKLLQLTEVPEWYHDESRNGTKACALNATSLLRLDGGNAWKIPYENLESVSGHQEDGVEVATIFTSNGEQLHCFFEQGEGVERFTRVIKAKIENF
jgi:hypothetical protein